MPSLGEILRLSHVIGENERSDEIKKFVRIVTTSKKTQEEEIACARKSTEDTVMQLQKPTLLIRSKESDLDKEAAKIEKKCRDALAVSDASFNDKLEVVLKTQVDTERILAVRNHYEKCQTLLQQFMTLINYLQREWPSLSVRINRDAVMDVISKVPSPALYKLRRKAVSLKVREMRERKTSDRLETVVTTLIEDASKRFTEFDDFYEDGGVLSQFEYLVDLMPAAAKKRLKEKMNQCRETPASCGELLLEECSDIVTLLKIADDRAMKILFLALTRYLFNDMYIRFFSAKLAVIDYTFSFKVMKILKLPPVQFPHSTKFLAPEYHLVPMCEFPEEHFYTGCIRMVQHMQFEVCPIDFCVAAHRCLREIENVAVFTRDDPNYAMSIDEVFDISMIVVVLACPLELPMAIESFSAYIEGLRLPSRLRFAFTTFKAICDNIVSMKLDDVCM